MSFEPDNDKEVGYYTVFDKPDDDLDPLAIVSQYPLAVEGSKHEYDADGKLVGFGFLGNTLAFYTSPFFRGKPKLYFIGGRLLRMSNGSSEESVMTSLGFVRNPAVAPDDFEN
ncbi:hypothetical protein OAO87_00250 [bacterium]|nr:hypothetical protein [bacterium]